MCRSSEPVLCNYGFGFELSPACPAIPKQHKVICRNAKIVTFVDFREHRLQRGIADFPLPLAFATDEVVMRFKPRDLVVGLSVTGISGDDDPKIDEESQRPVDRRPVYRPIRLAHTCIHITQRCMPLARADRFQDVRPLPRHSMTSVPQRLFPTQLVMCHFAQLPADFCDKPSRRSTIPRMKSGKRNTTEG